MTHYIRLTALSGMALLCSTFSSLAQSTAVKSSLFEGIIVTGYTDKSMYINCTGPAVKLSKKPFSLMIGLLPSLRIKDDKSTASQNTTVTPTLGFGATALYKHLALQIPFFYNAKTSTQNGNWKAGIGIGYKF